MSALVDFRSNALRGPVRPIWRINSTDDVTAELVTHTGQNTPSATNSRAGDDADTWNNWLTAVLFEN